MNKVASTSLRDFKVVFLIIGLVLMVAFVITNVLSMHDLWKNYIENVGSNHMSENFMYSFDVFDGRGGSFLDSGMYFLNISMTCVIVAIFMLVLFVRVARFRNIYLPAIFMVLFSIGGFVVLFIDTSYEHNFLDYMISNFAPIWLFGIAAAFLACYVTAFINRHKLW